MERYAKESFQFLLICTKLLDCFVFVDLFQHDWDHGVFISRNFIVGVWKMDKEQYAKYRYEKKTIEFRIVEQLQKDDLKAQRAEEARKLIEGEISEVLLPSKGSKEGGESLLSPSKGSKEGGGEEGEVVEEGGDSGEGGESIQQEMELKSEKAPSNETIEVDKEPSQEAFYSDEYDVPPDMIDVIKAAEIVYKPPEKPAKGKKGAGKPEKKGKGKGKKGKKGEKEEVKVEPPPPPPPPPEEVRERRPEREVEESQESTAGDRSEVEDKGDSKTMESKTSLPKSDEIKSEAGDSAAMGDYGADEGSEFEDEGSEEEDEGEVEEAEVIVEEKKGEGEVAAKAEEEEEIVEVEKSEMEILSIHGSILSVMEHILEGLFV